MWGQEQRTKGILAIILLALFSVFLGVVSRELSTSFTLFQQIYLRLTVASLLGFVVFRGVLRIKHMRTIPMREWLLIFFRAIRGLFIVGSVIAMSRSVVSTTK